MAKLKDALRVLKLQVQQPKGGSAIVLSNMQTAGKKVSMASGRVGQLEQELAGMVEAMNLQREVEQDLKKKIRLLEKARTKEDVDYEYIKNIFTKYVVFLSHGSAAEAKQMEAFLFDLLHFTKEEKESLEKARQSRSGFLGIFSAGGKTSVPGITGSYVHASTRSQSVQRCTSHNKTGTDYSFSQDAPGDFSGISSTSISIKNCNVAGKHKK